MPRSTWDGAISFGLIVIPVKLYSATQQQDIQLHQVHGADGGRIRYKRVCEVCGQEIPYDQIERGYLAPDGRQAVLTKEELEQLPLASSRTVDIVQFVDESEIDPVYFEKTYLIEANGVLDQNQRCFFTIDIDLFLAPKDSFVGFKGMLDLRLTDA